MTKALYILFAVAGYGLFGVVFGYYAFWLVGAVVPWTINESAFLPLTGSLWVALVMNSALIGAFLIPHSVMARPSFKEKWTQVVPEPIERAVYVWYSSLAMLLMMALWQPIPTALWTLDGAAAMAMYGAYVLGILILVGATFCIDHFELFGLKQVLAKDRLEPSFSVRFLYKFIRHPIALGHLIMVWAVPVMSGSHLLYTVLASFYVLLVTFKYEEKDLLEAIGPDYVEYKKTTPALLPVKF